LDFDLVNQLDDFLVPIEKEAFHKQKGFPVLLLLPFSPTFFVVSSASIAIAMPVHSSSALDSVAGGISPRW
jgi:hypothetical protein